MVQALQAVGNNPFAVSSVKVQEIKKLEYQRNIFETQKEEKANRPQEASSVKELETKVKGTDKEIEKLRKEMALTQSQMNNQN